MGRRALRKIDPALDLSKHLKELPELPAPWDAAVLFGRAAPLEIEAGSGKGMFIASASASRPERNYLGLEISRKYARFAAAKLARSQRPNAMIVHGDAQRVFQELLPDGCAAAVHVYFPDPWWKKRHKKRRIMNERFLKDIERTLQPHGELHFWTDVQEYFQTTLASIAAATALRGPLGVSEPSPADERDYRTHFERRMHIHGRDVFRAVFRKDPSA